MKHSEILAFSFELKKLLINISSRSFANLLSKALGLITLPIIARAFGPETYGDYNLVNIIIHYTSLPIGLLGLRMYGIREIAANRKSHSFVNDIISMQLSIAIVSVIAGLFVCSLIFQNNSIIFVAIILGYFTVFARAFDLEFFYISQKNMVFPTITGLAGQIFYLLGVILFIKNPSDFPLLILLSSLTPIISDILQLKRFHSKYSPIKIRLSLKALFSIFKKTHLLGFAQSLEGFVPTIPQLLLSYLIGSYALGIYSGGFRIYAILVLFYVTLFSALTPYIVQLNQYQPNVKRKYHLILFSIVVTASSSLGLLLYLFGEPVVILILGNGFEDSVLIFKIISVSLVLIKPIEMLLADILIYSGNERYYLYSLAAQGLTAIFASFFLLQSFQALGAVYVMILSMSASVIVLLYNYILMEWK